MNIGELFVNLGVKGSEKTIGAIKNTRQGLKDTASVALETKVALVGVFYALERLMAASGKMGTNLSNFNAVMGVSAQTLQQYQFAARQVGVSNEEVEGTFKSLQSTMTKTLMGEGAPKGLARVAQVAGGMTAQDVKRFAEQPQLLIQKLQEYAGKESNVGLRNEVLKSFGVGDNMIAALTKKAFSPGQLAKAPAYSDKEINSLDRANIAWSNLGTKIEMAVGHFNAKHGGEIVGDLSKIVDQVLKLANAFMKLSENAELFKWIGKVFEGWTIILTQLSAAVDELSGKEGPKSNEGARTIGEAVDMKPAEGSSPAEKFMLKLFAGLAPGGPGLFSALMPGLEALPKFGEKSASGFVVGESQYDRFQREKAKESGTSPALKLVAPPAPPGAGGNTKAVMPPMPAVASGGSTTQNVNVNQSLNFNHEGKDAAKTADSVKKATKDTYRTLNAQSQVN